MKISSKELLHALKKVGIAVSKNKITPILEYVKIQCNGNRAVVTATNYSLTCMCEFELLEESDECILIPFDELERICSVTTEIEIDKNLKVKFGREYSKLGVPEDSKNFSQPPSFDDAVSFDVDCDFFFAMSQAIKSINPRDVIQWKQNLFIDIKKDHIMLMAAGEASAYFNKINGNFDLERGVVVPTDFVNACKFMQDAKIQISDKNIKAYDGTHTIIHSLADYRMPAYGSLYAKRKEPNVTINKSDFLSTIHKAEATRTLLQFRQLNFKFKKDEIIIKSHDPELDREGEYYCHCINNSETTDIAFSCEYLKILVSQLTQDTINAHFSGEKDPVVFTEENTTILLQPLTKN